MTFNWTRASVLVTGGTGSFGQRCVARLLAERRPRRVVVFGRDEHKQHEMRQAGLVSPRLVYRVGDVRDPRALREALEGVDVVIHAAALKQVPLCEAQPLEAVLTNVHGAQHLIAAAREAGVARVVALSTDKAVHPANVYGATKLLAERLFVQADATGPTRFCVVRYGNVLGSRGSVLPALRAQRAGGKVTITDPRMTRFWLPLDEAVGFVLRCVEQLRGGEVFVPRVRGAAVTALIAAAAPGCAVERIGRRAGEKLHELLISDDEAPATVERDGMFVIGGRARGRGAGRPFRGERYASDGTEPFSAEELRALAADEPPAPAPPKRKRAR